jgi:hypothetical protein
MVIVTANNAHNNHPFPSQTVTSITAEEPYVVWLLSSWYWAKEELANIKLAVEWQRL